MYLICNHEPFLSVKSDIIIKINTGPEVITGSTRMKAGTATKMVLNMISTTTMIQLGKVYDNLMIDLMGNVKTVITNSSRRAVKIPVHDTTTTQIEFYSGATANLTTMTATASTWKLHLYGSSGSAYLPNQHKLEFTKKECIRYLCIIGSL